MHAIALACVTLGLAVGQNDTGWSSNYATALAAARAEGRPLLIVFENSSDPKHQIRQVSATVDRTQKTLLAKYQLCRIDVSTSQGKRVAEAFKVSQFPYTALTDRGSRWVIYRKTGQFSDGDWVNMLVSHSSLARWQSQPENCFT